ncbi:MAG: aspartate aminotransferase family protein [Actinomycetota bacterium]
MHNLQTESDLALRKRLLPSAYRQQNELVVVSASGAHVTDVRSRSYLDFTSGFGVTTVGHNHPAVVSAITEQARRLVHSGPVMVHDQYLSLAAALTSLRPGSGDSQVLLTSSGGEAVEHAVKIARYATGRPAIISFERAYHGRTMLTSSLSGKSVPYKMQPGAMAPDVYVAPFPHSYRPPRGVAESDVAEYCLGALRRVVDHQVAPGKLAAILLEPIQGEGGCIVPPNGFLREVQRIAHELGAILVVDEVLTGFGRTGTLFASQHESVSPDILIFGKTIGGGLPLGGILCDRELFERVAPGDIGGTYGGNPLACAAGLQVLAIVRDEAFLARARRIEAQIKMRLAHLVDDVPGIGDVRGRGAMFAVEIVEDSTGDPDPARARLIVDRCRAEGLVLVRTGDRGHVLRLLVPVLISDSDLDEGLGILADCIAYTLGRTQLG